MTLKSVLYSGNKFRDQLIKLATRCEETEISTFVNSYEDLKALFERYTPDV